jgi:hypothetical protein
MRTVYHCKLLGLNVIAAGSSRTRQVAFFRIKELYAPFRSTWELLQRTIGIQKGQNPTFPLVAFLVPINHFCQVCGRFLGLLGEELH